MKSSTVNYLILDLEGCLDLVQEKESFWMAYVSMLICSKSTAHLFNTSGNKAGGLATYLMEYKGDPNIFILNKDTNIFTKDPQKFMERLKTERKKSADLALKDFNLPFENSWNFPYLDIEFQKILNSEQSYEKLKSFAKEECPYSAIYLDQLEEMLETIDKKINLQKLPIFTNGREIVQTFTRIFGQIPYFQNQDPKIYTKLAKVISSLEDDRLICSKIIEKTIKMSEKVFSENLLPKYTKYIQTIDVNLISQNQFYFDKIKDSYTLTKSLEKRIEILKNILKSNSPEIQSKLLDQLINYRDVFWQIFFDPIIASMEQTLPIVDGLKSAERDLGVLMIKKRDSVDLLKSALPFFNFDDKIAPVCEQIADFMESFSHEFGKNQERNAKCLNCKGEKVIDIINKSGVLTTVRCQICAEKKTKTDELLQKDVGKIEKNYVESLKKVVLLLEKIQFKEVINLYA